MRAMILAAGRGERMRELTHEMPKPLLKVAGHHLIEYSIYALRKAGITEIIINICYHAEQIKAVLGDGRRYGVTIHYSEEETALETGGGIFQALPLLGDEPFLVMSSDIICDYPLQNLLQEPHGLAHLVLVDNPVFHPGGDFSLSGRHICYDQGQTLTFGNIGVYRPELFAHCHAGRFRLSDVLKPEIINQQVSGEYYKGFWHNVGTPEQLNSVLNHADKLSFLSE